MKHIGLHLGPLGYKIFQMPALSGVGLRKFENLPEDPYYKERCRGFSQYVLFYEHDRWGCRVLKHRPFIQAKAYNRKVGGIRREFEPISGLDPTPQLAAIATWLKFDKNEVFQINLHEWRTRVGDNHAGITVPEGPHRDGYHITSVTVWARHNIKGGESLLYAIGKSEPFFDRVLEPGEILIMRDDDMIHAARNIQALTPDGGYRDIWVISINPWGDRRYGDTFETYASAETEGQQS